MSKAITGLTAPDVSARREATTFRNSYYVFQFRSSDDTEVEMDRLQDYDEIYEVRKADKKQEVHYRAVISPPPRPVPKKVFEYYPLREPEHVWDTGFYGMVHDVLHHEDKNMVYYAQEVYFRRKGYKRLTFGSVECFYRNMFNVGLE